MATASKATPAPKARGRRAARASGDDRERAILETAERLLEERPLSEISVDDLAKGAGISRPTFYFYFPSKDAVVLTIIERLVPAAAGYQENLLATMATDPRASLRKVLEDNFSAFRKRRAVVLAAAELRPHNEEARELWTEIMEGWVADVAAVIDVERTRGAAPPGPPARELAIALVQMNERVQYGVLVGESPSLEDDRVLDVLVDIWLRTIYGTADPG